MSTLEANIRNNKTSGELKIIRQQGNVPGVVYGGSEKNQNVSVSIKVLKSLMEQENFLSKIIKLKVEGKEESVLPKDISFDVKRMFYVYDVHDQNDRGKPYPHSAGLQNQRQRKCWNNIATCASVYEQSPYQSQHQSSKVWNCTLTLDRSYPMWSKSFQYTTDQLDLGKRGSKVLPKEGLHQ